MGKTDGFGRTRWAAIGAAVAITLGAGGVGVARAAIETGDKPVFVSITPCRLVDTRPAPTTVGTRATPLGAGETATFAVRGANGNCVVPSGALSITANVTAVGPTASSYLTMFPADVGQPNSSVLNWSAGAPPIANAVTLDLSANGAIKAFNESGQVDLIIDLVGYFTDHHHDDRYYTQAEVDALLAANTAIGPEGPKGDPGTPGIDGTDGVDGTTLVDVTDLDGLSCTTPVLTEGGSDAGVVSVDVAETGASIDGAYSYDVAVTCDVPWPVDGTGCDDSNDGTIDDQFIDGDCAGTPVVCDDGDPYTADTVDGTECVFTPQALDQDADGSPATQAVGDAPPNDCDDTRSDVHPGAPEILGDEVDNDCDGAVDEN